MEKAIRKYWPIFVLPTFAAFIIGFVIPFGEGIYLSFCKFTTVRDAQWVGITNYAKIWIDNTFTHAFGFTAVFTVVTTVLINVLAFAVALLLTRGIRGTNVFRTVFFMPNLIAGLQNVPQDLVEAARIDGASPGQILRKIKIPMVMPSVTICTFLTLTNSFKLFDQNLSLTGGEPAHASEMLALNIYNSFYARAGAQWKGIGQAKAMVFFALVVVIALVQLHLTRSKEVQQ